MSDGMYFCLHSVVIWEIELIVEPHSLYLLIEHAIIDVISDWFEG